MFHILYVVCVGNTLGTYHNKETATLIIKMFFLGI